MEASPRIQELARASLSKASREVAAKAGTALPNGKYPIRNKRELRAALKLRHHSTEPYGVVRAHIATRAAALGVKLKPTQLASSAIVAACHSKACAPPPVGSGGSTGSGGGGGRGGGASTMSWSALKEEISIYSDFPRERIRGGAAAEAVVDEYNRRVRSGRHEPFQEITKAEARGDSKPVSREEFQRLANEGQDKLDAMIAKSSPAKGLDDNWDQIKADGYAEVTQSWGGATINAHTGQALPQGVEAYALTIKHGGIETVSVPESATRAEFDAAMDVAKETFRPLLEREGSHLGVFHDDDMKRIDIDPVLVVNDISDVHSIGAATRAIGGAYNFKDGNGYWPPHVEEG